MSSLIPVVIARTSTCSYTLGIKDSEGVIITDLTNWTCNIQLRNKRTGVLSGTVDREVTLKNAAEDRFLVILSSAETDISPDDYTLGAEFNNSTTSERKELKPPIEITITEGYVR